MVEGFKKSPKRLRKEKRRREKEREQSKQELEHLKKLYGSREAKLKNMKRLEKTPSFQKEFQKMKSILTGSEKPTKLDPFKGLKDFVNKDNQKKKRKGKDIYFDDFFKL